MIRHVVRLHLVRRTPTPERRATVVEALRRLPRGRRRDDRLTVAEDAGLADGNAAHGPDRRLPRRRGVPRYAQDPVHQAVIAEHVRPYLAARSAVQYRGLTGAPTAAAASRPDAHRLGSVHAHARARRPRRPRRRACRRRGAACRVRRGRRGRRAVVLAGAVRRRPPRGRSAPDLASGLLPAEAFGPDAAVVAVTPEQLRAGRRAGRGGPEDLQITPEECAAAVRGHPAATSTTSTTSPRRARPIGAAATVEVLVRGGPTRTPSTSSPRPPSAARRRRSPRPEIGTATITFEQPDGAPTSATARALLRYTTAVALPDGTQVDGARADRRGAGRRPAADPDDLDTAAIAGAAAAPRAGPGGVHRPARAGLRGAGRRARLTGRPQQPRARPTDPAAASTAAGRPQIGRAAPAARHAAQRRRAWTPGRSPTRPRRPALRPRGDRGGAAAPARASGRASRWCWSAWAARAAAGSG